MRDRLHGLRPFISFALQVFALQDFHYTSLLCPSPQIPYFRSAKNTEWQPS